jgi:hypothetical protein
MQIDSRLGFLAVDLGGGACFSVLTGVAYWYLGFHWWEAVTGLFAVCGLGAALDDWIRRDVPLVDVDVRDLW